MPQRKTTEEFIQRAREVHGDKYDYSKVEYNDCKTKVCIICPKHGEFYQIPKAHLRGHGCKKCYNASTSVRLTKYKDVEQIIDIIKKEGYETFKQLREKDNALYAIIKKHKWQNHLPLSRKRVKDGTYTLDYLIYCAENCKSKKEFREKYKNEYAFAQQNNLLDTLYKAHPLKLCGDRMRRGVYSYIFIIDNKKYVYVGLTYDFEKRHKQHITNNCGRGRDVIYSFCNKNNIEPPTYKIEYDYEDATSASMHEGEVLERYIQLGFIPLNTAKTGGLGGRERKTYTYDECKEIAQRYTSLTEWQKKDQLSYNFALKQKWQCDFIKSKHNFYKTVTTEMLINDLKKYNGNLTKWKKNNIKYYKIAERYGHMPQIRKFFNIPNPAKKVLQINPENGKIINEFSSIREAARYVKTGNTNISRAIRGEYKQCKGFQWKLKQDAPNGV